VKSALLIARLRETSATLLSLLHAEYRFILDSYRISAKYILRSAEFGLQGSAI